MAQTKNKSLLILLPALRGHWLEAFTLALARRTIQDEWNVTAAFAKTKETEALRADFLQLSAAYRACDLGMDDFGQANVSFRKKITRTIRFLLKERPSAVFVTTREIRHAAGPLIGAAVLGIPLVYFCPTADPHVPRRRSAKLFFRALTVRRQQHLFFAHFLGDAGCFSDAIEKRLASSVMDYLEKPHDINGLPLILSRADLTNLFSWPPDARIILVIAPLRAGSGYDNVAAAIPHIVAGHPEARLLWAGGGPKAAEFQQLVEQYQVAPYVQLVPESALRIAPSECADLLLYPAAFPNNSRELIRYAGGGAPLIATGDGAFSELLRPVSEHLLLDTDDIFDLREKALYALGHLDTIRAIIPLAPKTPAEISGSIELIFESVLRKIHEFINTRKRP